MKKIQCLAIMLVIALLVPVSISANPPIIQNEVHETLSTQNISITSDEFPDAYIITEFHGSDDIIISSSNTSISTISNPNIQIPIHDPNSLYNVLTNSSEILGIVNVTVFCEEKYTTTNINGISQTTVTSSRLLSEDEVLKIGVENFDNSLHPRFDISDSDSTSRGKLDISFVVTKLSLSGYAGSYDLLATANWSGMNIFPALNGENSPAYGEDFICLSWGGAFDYYYYFAHADSSAFDETDIYLSDATPNGGMAWSFLELQYYQGLDYVYVPEVYANIRLRKTTLTGDGNTTSAVFKYIHTYKEHSNSVSFSLGNNDSIAGSYTLSSVDKQWSLACTVSSIPY